MYHKLENVNQSSKLKITRNDLRKMISVINLIKNLREKMQTKLLLTLCLVILAMLT